MIDVYVINLPERTDRKKRLVENYKKYSDINLIFVEAIKNNSGHIGCTMSHQKCIQIAKDNNMDYIIVMEDDTIPKSQFDFSNELNNTLLFLKNRDDWNIYLGIIWRYNFQSKSIKKNIKYNNDNYVYVNDGNSTSLVIYNKKSYDFYLSLNPYESKPVDSVWRNKLIAVTRIPFYVKCMEVYSNTINKNRHENKLFDNTEKKILSFITNKKQQVKIIKKSIIKPINKKQTNKKLINKKLTNKKLINKKLINKKLIIYKLKRIKIKNYIR